jgi:ABC-type uncharacterized transport system substrate-binding protein
VSGASAKQADRDRLASARLALCLNFAEVGLHARNAASSRRPPLTAGLRWILAALALPLCIAGSSEASAHPHVFVVAKEAVIFGPDGRITGIRAAWTFDDMYSSFAIQGLGDEGKILTSEQLAPLAKTNVESLAEFGYFTVGKAAGKQVEFGEPTDYLMEESQDKLVTLHFTLPLKDPAVANKAFSLQVYDPTYFVSFDFADKDPIALQGAPAGCSTNVVKPRPLDSGENQKLTEAFFANMSPGMDFGIKLASRVIVACP